MAVNRKANAFEQGVVPEDLRDVVRESLSQASGVKVSELKKLLPVTHQRFVKQAQAIARELAAKGEIHHRKQQLFFARDPIECLDEALPTRLSLPLTESALKEVVAEFAPGHEPVLKEWLSQATKRGLVHVHSPAPRSKLKRYGARPDPRAQLKAVITALGKATEKTDKLGIPRAEVLEVLLAELGLPPFAPDARGTHGSAHAPGNTAASSRAGFMKALDALEAEHPREALFSVRDLRHRLELSKPEFDSLALALSREGAITLHHHDHPTSVPEAERSELVLDGQGTHYIGIARRRGA